MKCRHCGQELNYEFDEKIPRQDIYIDLSEEEKECEPGERLVLIGEYISERLQMVPRQVYSGTIAAEYVKLARKSV
jgi:transposase